MLFVIDLRAAVVYFFDSYKNRGNKPRTLRIKKVLNRLVIIVSSVYNSYIN